MQVNNAVKEGNNVKISVTVDKETFEAGIRKVYNKNKSKIMIPGFRKGKAPLMIVEKMYGKDIFYEDALEEIFPDVYQKVVLDEGWKAVGRPSITELDYHEDRTVDLTIESALYPEITLGEYKGLEVEKAEAVVTDEEVEKELDKKAEEVARISTVERPAEDGDTVVIDFEGFLDGVPFEGGKGTDYELRLGSHSFIPGFEEQLIGVVAGEDKEVNVSFPEDYHEKTLAGKPTVFQVKVHEVKQTIVPEKDDDLAKDVSEFDTLEELKEDIRANLLKTREDELQRVFTDAAVSKAVANAGMDVPACMIDEEVDRDLQDFDYQLKMQGMSIDQYAQMFGGLDKMKQSFRPGAEQKLKTRIVLEKVAEAEQLEIGEEELEAEFQKLADMYQMQVEHVKNAIPEEEIKDNLLVQKAQKLIVDAAVAVAPKEEKPEE